MPRRIRSISPPFPIRRLGDPLGYLEVWPTDFQPPHPVSTLNNPDRDLMWPTPPSFPPAPSGTITAYASSDTDLAIDINGYFSLNQTGGLVAVSHDALPRDRYAQGRQRPAVQRDAESAGRCGRIARVAFQPRAQAYVFNATVVPSGSLSYLTLWPDSQNQPVVSTLNAADGWITSNMAIVPNVNGKIDAYAAG